MGGSSHYSLSHHLALTHYGTFSRKKVHINKLMRRKDGIQGPGGMGSREATLRVREGELKVENFLSSRNHGMTMSLIGHWLPGVYSVTKKTLP